MDSIIMEEQLLAGGTNGGNGRRHSGATAAHVYVSQVYLCCLPSTQVPLFLGGVWGKKQGDHFPEVVGITV